MFPSHDNQVEAVRDGLIANTAVAIAGEDAQWTVMQACDGTDQSYGFVQDSWEPDTRVAAVVPHGDRLGTHLFVNTDLHDLPWALGELFDPLVTDCTLPVESPSVPDDAVLLGTSRIRGVNDIGGFDRWDRVYAVTDKEPTPFFVDMEATVYGGSTTGEEGAYRPAEVRLVTDFDDFVATVGPRTTEANGLSVKHTIVSNGNDGTSVNHRFTPQTAATRKSFTACARMEVHVKDVSQPFSYTGNGHFRWRDPQILKDNTWNHHTPGDAVWYS